jgi:adiponectin receptor
MSGMVNTTTDLQTTPADFCIRRRRRMSAPAHRPVRLQKICLLSQSIEALDLSTASPTQALASLRFLVLSYLADLEVRLSHLNATILDLGIANALKAKSELTIEEARTWAKVALEMLEGIREDVRSHLPEFHFANVSVEDFVKSYLPDFPDIPGFDRMRSRYLPDMPDVRSHFPDMRSHLSGFNLAEMRSKLGDVRSRFSDLDFRQPLNYVPVLSDHLRSLQSHLSSMEVPSSIGLPSLAPSAKLYELVDSMLSSDLLAELLPPPSKVIEGEATLERAAKEIKDAIKRSLEGARLLTYAEIPHQWRHNPFVTRGYR